MGLGGVVGIIGEYGSFLTEPLSTIYKAGIAYRQSNDGKMQVTVEGDEKEAVEVKEKGFELDEAAENARNESAEGEDGGRRGRRKKKSLKGWFPVWVEWKIGERVIQFRHSTVNRQIYGQFFDHRFFVENRLSRENCRRSEFSRRKVFWIKTTQVPFGFSTKRLILPLVKYE